MIGFATGFSVVMLCGCVVSLALSLWRTHRMLRDGLAREKRWAKLHSDGLARERQLCATLDKQTRLMTAMVADKAAAWGLAPGGDDKSETLH